MTVLVCLSQDPILRFVDNNGNALVGGMLTTLVGGVPYPTYSDSQGQFQLPNPIILNSRGEIATQNGTSTPLWVDTNVSYTYILQDAAGNTIWTSPNIISAATLPSITALLTQSFLAPILWPISPAEQAAGITPVNYDFTYGNVQRYGAAIDGSNATGTTQAINNCLQVTGVGGPATYMPAGQYSVNSDIIVPMGVQFEQGGSGPFGANLYGDGKTQTIINFVTGGTFTNGVSFSGGNTYLIGGGMQGVQINANGVASQALTISFGDTIVIRDSIVRGSTGQGILVDNSIGTRLEHIYLADNGSATAAQVEIDGSLLGTTGGTTTTTLDQVYISGSNPSCLCGIKIDRAGGTLLTDCAVESTGVVAIAISSKGGGTETRQASGVTLIGCDFENISDHYLEAGYGLASNALVTGLSVSNCTGQASGATTTPYAVKLKQCSGARFTNNSWAQPGTPGTSGGPVCTYWLEGPSGGLRTVIDEHAANFGSGYPWVMQNGVWVKSATPLVKFGSNLTPPEPFSSQKTVTGSTWSVLVNLTQGGWFNQLNAGNTGATTVNTLTDGSLGMLVYIKGDGVSTLAYGTGTNQFGNTSAGPLLLLSNQFYLYMFNGTYWDQIGS